MQTVPPARTILPLLALSNSRLASPMPLASSGILPGPQMRKTSDVQNVFEAAGVQVKPMMLPMSISSEPAKKPQAVGKATKDATRTRTEPVLTLLTSERFIMKTPTIPIPSVAPRIGTHTYVKAPHPDTSHGL